MTPLAAAHIAGADLMATGLEAFRLGRASVLVSLAFVVHPELLLQETWPAILLSSALAAASAVALALAVVGHGPGPLGPAARAALLAAAARLVTRRAILPGLGATALAAARAWGARHLLTWGPVSG